MWLTPALPSRRVRPTVLIGFGTFVLSVVLLFIPGTLGVGSFLLPISIGYLMGRSR
jgi:hypothetical protein